MRGNTRNIKLSSLKHEHEFSQIEKRIDSILKKAWYLFVRNYVGSCYWWSLNPDYSTHGMVAWDTCGPATHPLRILSVMGFVPFKLYENRAVTVSSFIPAAHAWTITKHAVAWNGSVKPEWTVPLGTWNFRHFKPNFLLNRKRPGTGKHRDVFFKWPIPGPLKPPDFLQKSTGEEVVHMSA